MSDKRSLPSRAVAIVGGILSLLNLLVGFLAYPYLPEKVPTHWNFAGEVDGWGTAWQGAFLLPLIIFGLYVMFVFLPKIDPKRANYEQMGRPYTIIILVIMVFFSLIYVGTIALSLGYMDSNLFPNLLQVGIGILFMVIGNYMGKVKHNYFLGVRTPWTLASEEVWNKTHRLAGPLWVVSGLVMMLSGILNVVFLKLGAIFLILPLVLVPIFYSYILFKRLEQ